MASSSEAMRVLELFELQSKEGPCLACYLSGRPVMDPDLATVTSRWPLFAAETLAAGFSSVQALPLRWRGTVIGALNLFHVEPGEMAGPDVEAAQALADVATIAILQHRASLEAQVLNQQLQHALNSRIVIEQAKGMVAAKRRPQHGASLLGSAGPCPQPQPAPRRRGRSRDQRRLGPAGAGPAASGRAGATTHVDMIGPPTLVGA